MTAADLRDPRTDPQPGDALRLGQGWIGVVTGRDKNEVMFVSSFSPGQRQCSISVWQRNNEAATVIWASPYLTALEPLKKLST